MPCMAPGQDRVKIHKKSKEILFLKPKRSKHGIGEGKEYIEARKRKANSENVVF